MASVPHLSVGAAEPPRRTVSDLLDRYAEECLPLKQPTTARQLTGLYVRIRAELGTIPLADLTPLILRRWRDHLVSEGYKPGMVRRYLETLSGPLTYAWQELGWIAEQPMRKVKKPSSGPGRVRFLDDAEKQRLLAACRVSRNPHLYPLVILALSTGARKMELLTLTWAQIDLEKGIMRLEVTKNKERRTLPITGLALQLLRQQRSAERWRHTGWVFPRADGQEPVRIDVAWQHAVRRAGVDNFRFHDLRHTAASYLVMEGASIIEVADILGHKTLQMVKRYSHISAEHTEKIASKLTQRLFGDITPAQEGGDDATV